MIAQMIEERIDTLEVHISWKSIEDKLGLSKGSLTHFKNGTELSFHSLRTISTLLHYRNPQKVLAKWCTHLKKAANVKYAFEFLSSNRYWDYLDCLSSGLQETSSPLIKDLIKIYFLLSEYQKGKYENLKEKAESLELKSKEAKFLQQMCFVYYYNSKQDYINLEISLKSAEKSLELVKDTEIQKLFMIRITEIRSIVALFHQREELKSRELSEEIIKKCVFFGDTYLAKSYYRIGMSYLFSSPDMCLAYLEKAVKTYKSIDREDSAHSIEINEIELAKILWGRVGSVDDLVNISSKMHYYAKNGLNEKALEVGKELNCESPFTKYYEGIARDDENLVLESLVRFTKNGSYFYATLPFTRLRDSEGLSTISNLLFKK
jgi:hypothetical protein